MGGNRSLMGINREMRRGKRGIFSSNVTCQISYCCLQYGMQLPDVPLQHLSCLPLLHFSFHAPLQRRLCLIWQRLFGARRAGCFSRRPRAGSKGPMSGNEEGRRGEAEPRGAGCEGQTPACGAACSGGSSVLPRQSSSCARCLGSARRGWGRAASSACRNGGAATPAEARGPGPALALPSDHLFHFPGPSLPSRQRLVPNSSASTDRR